MILLKRRLGAEGLSASPYGAYKSSMPFLLGFPVGKTHDIGDLLSRGSCFRPLVAVMSFYMADFFPEEFDGYK